MRIEFDITKCERLEYASDLCLGRLYVIRIDNPHFDEKEDITEFNCEYYYVDAVYIGSEPVYNEEGDYYRDDELFAEIGEANVYKISEPKYQVFLDEQYNIKSRYYYEA